jgi:hypothetical protein
MPCPSYGLPAERCVSGSKLAKKKGTACSICYATKGRYMFPNVQAAQELRLLKVLTEPRWVEAMVFLIKPYTWFRWHDSGDVQSYKHLNMIFRVCEQTPRTQHWLPTVELELVRKAPSIPSNLVIRYSLPKIDQGRPSNFDLPTSNVVTEEATCYKSNASLTGNCDDCRDCWDKRVKHITYKRH